MSRSTFYPTDAQWFELFAAALKGAAFPPALETPAAIITAAEVIADLGMARVCARRERESALVPVSPLPDPPADRNPSPRDLPPPPEPATAPTIAVPVPTVLNGNLPQKYAPGEPTRPPFGGGQGHKNRNQR